MKPINIGIIGCGVIGQIHMRFAAEFPQARVMAVADMNLEAALKAAQIFQIPKWYDNGADLIDDPEIEAVVLALPAASRTELALRTLQRKKHLLIEKPVAMNAEEVRSMLEAKGNSVAACCSSRFHFLPSARFLTEFVASGKLGDLRVIRGRVVQPAGKPPQTPPPAWRLKKAINGGGIMVNWGSYDLDYILGITGWKLKPLTVLASCWNLSPQYAAYGAPGSDAETHVSAMISCEGGIAVTLERAEFAAAQPDESWEIIGTEGSLRFQMNPHTQKTILYTKPDPVQGTVVETVWSGDEDFDMTHAGPLADFTAAIQQGSEPLTNLEKALTIQTITDAIYSSAAAGRAVQL